MKKQKPRKKDRVVINHSIRASEVRCIDENDQNIGVIKKTQAVKIAQKAGLDLVMISPSDPPVCKILDAGKYKYDLSKKRKEQAKKQKESTIKVKEIKFRPTTDSHDLETKARQATKFLAEGCQIKVSVNFKGREVSHQEVGQEKVDEFISLIEGAEIHQAPQMNGRQMTCILAPPKELSKAG